MLGLCLCNVAFGVSGMALSAMSVPAHVCSFVMFIFGIALFSPFLFGVDYWRVPGTMFGVLPCGLGEGTDLVSACSRALLVWKVSHMHPDFCGQHSYSAPPE